MLIYSNNSSIRLPFPGTEKQIDAAMAKKNPLPIGLNFLESLCTRNTLCSNTYYVYMYFDRSELAEQKSGEVRDPLCFSTP